MDQQDARRDAMVKLLCEAVNAPSSSLPPDQSLADLDGWDSLAMVALVATAKETLGVQLAIERVAACRTVSDILGLV